MKKLFTKKEIFKVKSMPIDPSQMGEPTTAEAFQHRGMAYYARKKYPAAEADLNAAVALDGNNIDSFYCLGMVLKAMYRKNEAIGAFEKVINLIQAGTNSDKARNDMLKRLARGHINEVSQGDWNLEKEIWQRIT